MSSDKIKTVVTTHLLGMAFFVTNFGDSLNKQLTTANQRAARITYTIRLDSTQNIPPRICRLPAHAVETRITVAGDIHPKKSLALAVRCIGFVVNMYIVSSDLAPNL